MASAMHGRRNAWQAQCRLNAMLVRAVQYDRTQRQHNKIMKNKIKDYEIIKNKSKKKIEENGEVSWRAIELARNFEVLKEEQA